MNDEPLSEYPPLALMGAETGNPDLTDDEWAELEAGCAVSLSADARRQVSLQLWWCQWARNNASKIPRLSELKRRLKAFVRGVDMALDALGYLSAAHIDSVGARPPVHVRMIDKQDSKVWYALMNAARSTNWTDGYLTNSALERGGDTDATLMALHALGYTASRAIEGWDNDKGGRVGGGDSHFALRLIEILHEGGVAVSYTHDRTTDAGHEMSGPGWFVFRHIWSIRPDAFTTTEHSTLGNLYRAAYKRFKERTDRK
jgi:hypothetical protein